MYICIYVIKYVSNRRIFSIRYIEGEYDIDFLPLQFGNVEHSKYFRKNAINIALNLFNVVLINVKYFRYTLTQNSPV